MRPWFPIALSGLVSTPILAGDITVAVEIPKLAVAEYHRPYVAIWIEGADQKVAANLAVWYEMKKANNEGTKWLKDIRQWWRKSGRDLAMPVDGVSSATRPPGSQTVAFSGAKAPLNALPPGSYQLVVEAAREVGGRELLRVPFDWPTSKPVSASAQGSSEFGTVTLTLTP
jgi:hypothetical protein